MKWALQTLTELASLSCAPIFDGSSAGVCMMAIECFLKTLSFFKHLFHVAFPKSHLNL